jgi:hypothetical protein
MLLSPGAYWCLKCGQETEKKLTQRRKEGKKSNEQPKKATSNEQ